jgi:hypothetical protein
MLDSSEGTDLAIVFVLGVPRSGTTLLTYLLAQHPAILCPQEPWFMLALESLGSVPATHPCDPELIRLATSNLLSQSRTEILGLAAQTVYGALLARSGKRILLDKTPRYYHILPFIRKTMPHARFIWIRRNPLDVAASYQATWNIDIASLIGDHRDIPHFFDFALGFRLLADFADENDVCVVSYEDLVDNPQAQLNRIFDHMGIPARDIAQFRPTADAQPFGRFGDQKILQTQSVHSESIGSFRSALSPIQQETIVRALGGEIFSRLGYRGEYECVVRSLGGAIPYGPMPIYEEALHLLSRRAAWAQGDTSEWYSQKRQIEMLKEQNEGLSQKITEAEAGRAELASALKEAEDNRAELTNALRGADSNRAELANALQEAATVRSELTNALEKAGAELTGSVRDAEASHAALANTLRQVESERAAVIAERDAILASRTWRATAFLRKARTRLSRPRS